MTDQPLTPEEKARILKSMEASLRKMAMIVDEASPVHPAFLDAIKILPNDVFICVGSPTE